MGSERLLVHFLLQLSKTYGPVFTFHLGPQKIVVLVGYEVVKEALLSKGNEFIDRPPIPIFLNIQHENGNHTWE